MTKILTDDLGLTQNQMEFVIGGARELKVEVITNDERIVLISRKGPGFFTNVTPAEIAAVLKPYF